MSALEGELLVDVMSGGGEVCRLEGEASVDGTVEVALDNEEEHGGVRM